MYFGLFLIYQILISVLSSDFKTLFFFPPKQHNRIITISLNIIQNYSCVNYAKSIVMMSFFFTVQVSAEGWALLIRLCSTQFIYNDLEWCLKTQVTRIGEFPMV